MPTFEYQAEKTDGSVESGFVFGSSLDSVASELANKGMRVLRLGIAQDPNDPLANRVATPRPVETPRMAAVPTGNPYDTPSPVETPRERERMVEQRSYVATSVFGPIFGKVPLSQLGFFFRQGSAMLHAGVPIVQAFTTLSRQSQSPKLRHIIAEMASHAEAGRPISAGMQRYPEVFTPVMLSLVRAGEEGGFLEDAMTTIADYIDQEIEIRNLYRRVTFYPKLQIVASVIIIIGANLILSSLNTNTRLHSPLTTVSTWFWLGPLIIGLYLFLRVGLANPRVKYNWDLFVSYVPYIGKTMRQLSMARFGRAFAALYHCGVPIAKALPISADACGNEYLRAKMYPAYRELENGVGISETLRSTNAFSPIVMDMVQTGETTGNLDQMLNKVSDFYIEEGKTRSLQTGMLVGVFIGLFVMIYIGYIIITFYMGMGQQTTEMINGKD